MRIIERLKTTILQFDENRSLNLDLYPLVHVKRDTGDDERIQYLSR